MRVIVPAIKLGQILQRHCFSHGSWLIMDIEGDEHEIIPHSPFEMKTFAGIVIESHNRGHHKAEDVFLTLEKLGFIMLERRGNVACFKNANF